MRNSTCILLLVIGVIAVYGQSSNDTPTVSDRCSEPYDVRKSSRFSKQDKKVISERRSQQLVITNVEVIEREFYPCLRIFEEEGRRIQNYGFNDTHWFVQKGCSGVFRITECEPVLIPASADLAMPVPL